MRARIAGLVLLLVGPALGFDSVCFVTPTGGSAGAPPCTPGPEAARNRWLGPSDEHRALLEFSRVFGGLPREASQDFTLTVFTSDQPVAVGAAAAPSLEPLNFFDARRAQDRTMSVPEFAELPDHGFALWDWARGLELCPLDASLPAPASAVDCHDFSTHMGAVNSNHFVPQAQFFYQYYHTLALDRATACAEAERRITSQGGNADDFRDFLRACEDEALVIEATGQHFLQDAWSTGHMWERWGSPDLGDFTGISQALIVAITSGLIHGAKAVLEDIPVSHPDLAAALATAGVDLTQYTWNDPLCAPAPDVTWVGPGQTTPAPGAGDLFLTNLIAGQGASFPDQYRRLFSCGAAGLRAVYEAAGAQHGPLGPLAPGLDAVDPGSDACFAQRATNHAMARGIGLDFTDPTGAAQRIELSSLLASLLVPGLSAKLGATLTPLTSVQFRVEMAFIVTPTTLRDLFAPNDTDLAEGGLGAFMGVDRNLDYVNRPLAPYVDPPLPWPSASGASGDDAERATWLARVFHRAHALQWCNRFKAGAGDFLDVDALRSKVETLRSIGAGADEIAAACGACGEFAARHLRVGHDATDYDRTREPLCRFLADDPASAQYVFQPGSSTDTRDTLAADYCGCGAPSGGIPSEADLDVAASADHPITGDPLVDQFFNASNTDRSRPFPPMPLDAGKDDDFDPGDGVSSHYTVRAIANGPVPPALDLIPSSGTYTGDVRCSASGASVTPPGGSETKPLLPSLDARASGSFDVSTTVDDTGRQVPSITLTISGVLTRGPGVGDLAGTVSNSGRVEIESFSEGAAQAPIQIDLPEYTGPGDAGTIDAPFNQVLTVRSPGRISISWDVGVFCSSRGRANAEGAAANLSLTYSVTR